MNIYWLAGLLEGEGSFAWKGAKGSVSPIIRCTMTDKDILDRIPPQFGGRVRFTKLTITDKEAWTWTIQGRDAIDLMEQLYPMMGNRRRERILETMNRWGERQVTNLVCKNGHYKIGSNCYMAQGKWRVCKECARDKYRFSISGK